MQRIIEILVNNSELTAGTRGASLGPAAMMTAARKSGSTYFSRFPVHHLPDFNYFLDRENDSPHAKYIEGYSKVFRAVADKTAAMLGEGKFPFLLSGDHGSAAGTISGIRKAFPEKKLGIIWIDAHSDIHSPYTTPSGNMHGMPLSLSLGDDNLQHKRNDPDAKTVATWNELRDYSQSNVAIDPKHLVFIAVRDTEEEEDAIMERLGITNHTVAEIRSAGVAEIIEKTLTQLEQCDIIYVSFDVDSMDPQLTSFGTGTPVGNGITPEEAKEMLTLLGKNEKLVCMEMVEVNPCLDNKINTMAETAFSLLEAATNAILES